MRTKYKIFRGRKSWLWYIQIIREGKAITPQKQFHTWQEAIEFVNQRIKDEKVLNNFSKCFGIIRAD